MDKNEFYELLKELDIYDHKEYTKILAKLKHNLCQNMRIARKISKIKLEAAAQLLNLEPQSLRRIEAKNDRDEFSVRVLIMAIMIYKPDANFYFNKWEDNEKLLNKKEDKVYNA